MRVFCPLIFLFFYFYFKFWYVKHSAILTNKWSHYSYLAIYPVIQKSFTSLDSLLFSFFFLFIFPQLLFVIWLVVSLGFFFFSLFLAIIHIFQNGKRKEKLERGKKKNQTLNTQLKRKIMKIKRIKNKFLSNLLSSFITLY